eukprot:812140-Pyramimonas_sp.AAC.1
MRKAYLAQLSAPGPRERFRNQHGELYNRRPPVDLECVRGRDQWPAPCRSADGTKCRGLSR